MCGARGSLAWNVDQAWQIDGVSAVAAPCCSTEAGDRSGIVFASLIVVSIRATAMTAAGVAERTSPIRRVISAIELAA
jgi:hypothetical protein